MNRRYIANVILIAAAVVGVVYLYNVEPEATKPRGYDMTAQHADGMNARMLIDRIPCEVVSVTTQTASAREWNIGCSNGKHYRMIENRCPKFDPNLPYEPRTPAESAAVRSELQRVKDCGKPWSTVGEI